MSAGGRGCSIYADPGEEIPNTADPTELLNNYDWIWPLDEDVDVRTINISTFFVDASRTGASIVSPARLRSEGHVCGGGQSQKDHKCLFRRSQPSCFFRYVNFVEVTAPMLRPWTLWNILTKCEHCIHEESLWGLDHVWCMFSATLQERAPNRICAILDQHEYIHMDFRTMNKTGDSSPLSFHHAAFEDTKKHHPDDFIAPNDLLHPKSQNQFRQQCIKKC